MSLLEEGIATGNVLPTGRKEKHSIDNVTRDFDIYRIKCDLLFYNDQNDRIATWVSEYNSAQRADLLALGRDEYNGVIEDFIVESNPGALRKTEKSIALRGQLRPGIVLNDGRVIDGNRRLTCVRRLARASNEAGWFEAAILDDATGSDPKHIKLLEQAIQIGEEEKVAYDPVDRLVGIYRDVVKNHLITQGIKYVSLPEEEWYTMRDLELENCTVYLGQNAWKPDMAVKSLYNYVVYDSAGVERSFAEALDKQEEVPVFAKLPSAFKIDTPLGSYNRDWAYVEEADGERRGYFVTETKGGKNGEPALRDAEKIKIGCFKKHFEALDLGNDFHYNVRTTYQYEAVKA